MLLWQKIFNDDGYRLLLHQAAVGRNWPTVAFVKNELSKDEPDSWAIYEAWDELPFEEKILLGHAPTKGGCFTVNERALMRECLSIVGKSIRESIERNKE